MDPYNSLDEIKLIDAMLHDVFKRHGAVFNYASRKNTLKKVSDRFAMEGIGFLTRSLPRLGKSLDKALACQENLSAVRLGFEALPLSNLPVLLGELFELVLKRDGGVREDADVTAIRSLRDILYCFYKYKLPYTADQAQEVVTSFKSTEVDLSTSDAVLAEMSVRLSGVIEQGVRRENTTPLISIVREARILLSRLFSGVVKRDTLGTVEEIIPPFDPFDIVPRHGPGAVATRQRLWEKYRWSNVSSHITDVYPLDAFFYASLGHVCDRSSEMSKLASHDLPARVVLVPKDSRRPRLISCESVDKQWIQQGLSVALMDYVERHPLTRESVHFSDQRHNQIGALLGSLDNMVSQPPSGGCGRYATLDLNEASDRVSLELVRLLFPPHIVRCLEATRSSATELPDGEVLKLRKFAPMGSALCFPILSLTVWSLLRAAADNEYTRDRILVYGDDVIVTSAFAQHAMTVLEAFGLKVNADKSCTKGFFRESCGVDAYKGVDVTPIRFRTVWTSNKTPGSYTAWIAYANSLWDKNYRVAYQYVVGLLHRLYGAIPGKDMELSCPSLAYVTPENEPKRRRVNPKGYQTLEYNVWDVSSPTIKQTMDGWSMLLRFFVEAGRPHAVPVVVSKKGISPTEEPFRVRSYTRRDTSLLVRRWRSKVTSPKREVANVVEFVTRQGLPSLVVLSSR